MKKSGQRDTTLRAAVIPPKDRQARSEARDLRAAVIPAAWRDLRGNQNETQWIEGNKKAGRL